MLQLFFIVHILFWGMGPEIGGSKLPLSAILLLPIGMIWIVRNGLRLSRISIRFSSVVLPIIGIWLVVGYTGLCTDGFAKAILSAPIWFLLALLSVEVGARTTPDSWLKLRKTAFIVLVIAIITSILELSFPHLIGPDKLKYHASFAFAGIYNEPSHAAISLFPCLIILLLSKDTRDVRRGLLAVALLLMLTRSTTLIALMTGFSLCFFYNNLSFKKFATIISFLIIFIFVAYYVDYDLIIGPIEERLLGLYSTDTTNMSSMVYIKGWQDGWGNILRTYGLGLGFNMMGCSPLPLTDMFYLLQDSGGLELNNTDGSFLLAKLMSEFGVFGVLLFGYLCLYFIVQAISIKKCSNGKISDSHLIQLYLIFSFLMIAMIRTTGYFHSSVFIVAIALSSLIKKPLYKSLS